MAQSFSLKAQFIVFMILPNKKEASPQKLTQKVRERDNGEIPVL
jgi:hypothetical protein